MPSPVDVSARRLLLLAAAALAVGCSEAAPQPASKPPPVVVERCPPGEAPLEGDRCLPAGLQPSGCAAGEVAVAGGGCRPAGVPPEMCADGFVPDDEGGCDALLPDAPCPDGMLALPGERSCREVWPCGSGGWGDVPIGADTQHVDASYAGGDGDGSAAKPWTTVQAALDAAADGSIVAIAAGSYAEDLALDKPVRLWGRCPALVELTGVAAAAVRVGSADVEIHQLALTGRDAGVSVEGNGGVLVDASWIHHTGSYGVAVIGPDASAALSGSLLQATGDHALYVEGGAATVSGSMVRDTLVSSEGARGINLRDDTVSGARGNLIVQGSVVVRSHEVGIMVHASDARVAGSVVRDDLPALGDRFGRGINVQSEPSTGERGALMLEGSLIEGCLDGGVVVFGSDVELEHSTVRDIHPNLDAKDRGYCLALENAPGSGRSQASLRSSMLQRCHEALIFVGASDLEVDASALLDGLPTEAGHGRSLNMQDDPIAGEAAEARVTQSRFERAQEVGVYVQASHLLLEGVRLSDVVPNPDGKHGRGISAQSNPDTLVPAELELRWSTVERTHEVGISINGSRAQIEATIVADTAPLGTLAGNGIEVVSPSEGPEGELTLRWSVVARQTQVGVLVAGRAELDSSVVSNTRASGAALWGDGVAVFAYLDAAEALLSSMLVVDSDRAGVATFGGSATLTGTALECNAVHLVRQDYGGQVGALSDGSHNACGCHGVAATCKALETGGLKPPEPPKDTL